MARMRTLKPEFWDSPSTAQASLAARLLFLAMWNWADDSGRGTAGLKELEAFAFPNDDIREYARNKAGISGEVPRTTPELYRNFAELCGDVAEAYGVMFYQVKSRPYYVIPSFKAHQAKDFRSTSKYPLETEGQFFDVTSGNMLLLNGNAGNSAPMAGEKEEEAGTRPVVIGEQGKRVIGEKGNRGTEEKDLLTGKAVERVNPKTRFDEFWKIYPRKVGKDKAESKYATCLKRADEQTIIDGALALANDPNLPEKKYIPHPTTWLERGGWNDEPLAQRWDTPKSDQRLQQGFDLVQRVAARSEETYNYDPFAGKAIEQ